MPTKKLNKTKEVISQIFKDTEGEYSLKEFEGADIEETLEITEEEPKRFYIKDLKSGKLRFVFDESKQTGRPEEIIRQLWLHKLNSFYKYPFDRIDMEKSIHFGREIYAKSADIIVYKKDKITPYIIIEVKSPTEKKVLEGKGDLPSPRLRMVKNAAGNLPNGGSECLPAAGSAKFKKRLQAA